MRFKVKIIRQMTTARANTRRYRKQPTYVYRRKRKVQVGNKAGILTVQVTDSLSGGVAPRHAPRAVPRCTALGRWRAERRRSAPAGTAAAQRRRYVSPLVGKNDGATVVFTFSFSRFVLTCFVFAN